MDTRIIKEVERQPEKLPDEQEFFIRAELWDSNYIHVGYANRDKKAVQEQTSKNKSIILKFTISVKDFDEILNRIK